MTSPPPSKAIRIVFQGDSITDAGRVRDTYDPNVGVALGSGYVYQISAKLLAAHPSAGMEFYNRGVSGNRILDLYARWKSEALIIRPHILSILAGVNDCWHQARDGRGSTVARFARNYRDVLEWTREEAPDCALVLCEPFALAGGGKIPDDWLPDLHERAAAVRELAGEFGAIFIAFQSVFDRACASGPPRYWLPDGVHPSPGGHDLMAAEWIAQVRPVLDRLMARG